MEKEFKWSILLARKKSGLTQAEMAEKLGLTRVTYIKYEAGKLVFRIDVAHKFSEIVGLSLDEIIFFNNNYT